MDSLVNVQHSQNMQLTLFFKTPGQYYLALFPILCVTDALQGDDDAAADKAIRLVPHFVGGLSRNAPGRRRRTSDGDETDAFDDEEDTPPTIH